LATVRQRAGKAPLSVLKTTQTGERLDRFELIAEIATGGMATVFLARLDGVAGFQRFYAIKRLHPHLANDAEFVDMFLDEARLAAQIHHPNVVPILEVGTSPEGYYLVMDYIEGATAARLMAGSSEAGERLPVGSAFRICVDSLAGLHSAHELADGDGRPLQIVHRDVSPQNILVGIDGGSRIADFGIARAATRLTTTRTGQLKGKLGYMAPEQARGAVVDRRADIWALGVVLWEMLAGTRLFKAKNDAETLHRILYLSVPTLRESGVELPEPLESACMRALEREPGDRYATAAEFGDALEQLARPHDMLAATRDVAAYVNRAIGTEMSQQREILRGWLSASDPKRNGPRRAAPHEDSTSGVLEVDPRALPGSTTPPGRAARARDDRKPPSSVDAPEKNETTRTAATSQPPDVQRLLTIDDSPTVRNLVRVYLMGMNFEFIEAARADQGLTMLASNQVDLVIVDVNMPGMDGLAFLREVRSSRIPAVRHVPVVLLTSDKSPATRARAISLGASGFVLKPVTSSNLREAVTMLLTRASNGG